MSSNKEISLATQLVKSNEALLWLYNSVIAINRNKGKAGKVEKMRLEKAMKNAETLINSEHF